MRDLPDWPGDKLQRFCQEWASGGHAKIARRGHRAADHACTTGTSPTGDKRRATARRVVAQAIERLFDFAPLFGEPATRFWRRVTFATRDRWRPRRRARSCSSSIPKLPAGGRRLRRGAARPRPQAGWKQFAVYRLRGQRFHGAGCGPGDPGVRLDLYGSNGDYTASGMDGLEIHIHATRRTRWRRSPSAASWSSTRRGADIYVRARAAKCTPGQRRGPSADQRVGHPRVVINGTCLDFLADRSWLAIRCGRRLRGVERITFDAWGRMVALNRPTPAANLFSLRAAGRFTSATRAKGGERQLNAACFSRWAIRTGG